MLINWQTVTCRIVSSEFLSLLQSCFSLQRLHKTNCSSQKWAVTQHSQSTLFCSLQQPPKHLSEGHKGWTWDPYRKIRTQNISCWKWPIKIIKSSSLVLAGLPRNKPCDWKHQPDAPWSLVLWPLWLTCLLHSLVWRTQCPTKKREWGRGGKERS